MSAVDRFAAKTLLLVLLLLGAWFGIRHYGVQQRQAGYNAAVLDGKAARDAAALAALAIESGLRSRLLEQDTAAFNQERKHAESLEAAQRRVRAGVDSLRCPAAGTVPAGAAPGDRPAAAGSAVDGYGPAIVSEVAAEILGDGAAAAGLVRRYERLIQRFEACRALNAQ